MKYNRQANKPPKIDPNNRVINFIIKGSPPPNAATSIIYISGKIKMQESIATTKLKKSFFPITINFKLNLS